MSWQPSIGAWKAEDGVRFRVWAPDAGRIEVVLEGFGDAPLTLHKQPDGTFTGSSPSVRPGNRYRYRVDSNGPFPDPASRFQPEGPHGPSEIVDPSTYMWRDRDWPGLDPERLVIYELHVGTFTPEGTYAGVISKLPLLKDLGVNAIELMPLAEFPGTRGWGYDGVDLYAPFHGYGRPDDLRALVDTAHAIGLGVMLDVVYNHFGPSGNYTSAFSKHYLTDKHSSPWGAGVNFDDVGSEFVRAFFIENALQWVHDYHIDGLRLDATHALIDDSERHFLAEFTAAVRAATPQKRLVIVAEDHRNMRTMMVPHGEGGWGFDGVWADDFHHEVRVRLNGDREAYYADYTGRVADLARTINQGWFYTGQWSEVQNHKRGTSPVGLAPSNFVVCIQNHDQVGNRALGERLNQQIPIEAYRAATALLLMSPQTPMLFMGQEWASSSPFLFFTDHDPELGRLVTEGRRNEFRQFAAFADPAIAARIPDPQALSTFEASKLKWDEIEQPPHHGVWRLNQALLKIRDKDHAFSRASGGFQATALTDDTLAILHKGSEGEALLAVVHLGNGERVELKADELGLPKGKEWLPLLTTEDEAFTETGRPPQHENTSEGLTITFACPSALVVRTSP